MVWAMVAVALGFVGLTVLAVFAVRVFLEAGRLGREVAVAAQRIGRAADDLEKAAGRAAERL
jgi:formate-dependent phosphoribosylglycinamide formyltransferase (GAR transformylase)